MLGLTLLIDALRLTDWPALSAAGTKRQDQADDCVSVVDVPEVTTAAADKFLSRVVAAAAALVFPPRRLSLMSELNFEAKIATLLGGMAIETLKPGTFLWNDDDEGRRRTLRGR